MFGFSRKPKRNPSQRYLSLIEQYREMHSRGSSEDQTETFTGYIILHYIDALKRVCDVLMPQTILDYGSGKGRAYNDPDALELEDGSKIDLQSYLRLSSVTYYDPGFEPYSGRPSGKFDGVVCSDVLEHCPEEDIDWILGEIFGYAREFVFVTIAGYPAVKHLPNGENAHITLKPLEWWNDKLNAALEMHPGLRFYALYDAERTPGTAQSLIRAKNV